MARTPIAAALAIATITLLIIFHLISTFGLPRLDYLHLRYVSNGAKDVSPQQIPINPPTADHARPEDASMYMLGVGKADITGYVGDLSRTWQKLTVSPLDQLSKSI